MNHLQSHKKDGSCCYAADYRMIRDVFFRRWVVKRRKSLHETPYKKEKYTTVLPSLGMHDLQIQWFIDLTKTNNMVPITR